MQGFCDTLLIDMGIADLNMKCSLHIVYSEDVNAFTALTEDGFAMCITSGLFLHKGITYEMLMGFVAHEFAHGALMHHLKSLYAEAKERRKNELIGAIAAGLNAVAAGADAYTSAITGNNYDSSTYTNAIEQIGQDIKISTLKYTYKFSRDEEYESDLVAFRFLQNLEKGEEFINGLRLIGTEYDNLYSEYSDHPTISSRIAFLKYLTENPQLGNTENAKLQKKRAKANIK
jgi:predicted Zn-dependent protease